MAVRILGRQLLEWNNHLLKLERLPGEVVLGLGEKSKFAHPVAPLWRPSLIPGSMPGNTVTIGQKQAVLMKLKVQKETTFIESLPRVRHCAKYFSFNEAYCLVGGQPLNK